MQVMFKEEWLQVSSGLQDLSILTNLNSAIV